MVQTLQIWSIENYLTFQGGSARIKSFVANADGGYTVFYDRGMQSFSNAAGSVGYTAFGLPAAAAVPGGYFTGFVEWAGQIDEVVRIGTDLAYTYDVARIVGLSPGGYTIRAAAGEFTAAPLTGVTNDWGPEFFTANNPTFANFSMDTAPIVGGVATVVTSDSQAWAGAPFLIPGSQPGVVTGIIRDVGGITVTTTLAAPGGAAVKDAAVTGFTNGSYLGLWAQDGSDGSGFGIRGQRVDQTSTKLGSNTTINQNTTGTQDQAHAATMADGNAFIVWRDASGTLGVAAGTSIKGRIMRPDGTFATAEFRINQTTTGDQSEPYALALNVNQVLVLWIDRSTAVNQIRGVVVDLAGNAASNELVIETGVLLTNARGITATVLSDGRVTVGYIADSAGSGTVSQAVIVDPRPEVIFGTGAGELILGRGHWFAGPTPDDTIVAGSGNDTLWGFAGNDQLYGEAGDDTIYGGSGNDIINGGADNDTLWGELYTTDTGDDVILGGSGNDVVFAQNGNDQLHGEDGDDILLGGEDDDTLFGGADNDGLHGEGGNDTALGGAGNDAMWGYDGTDVLYGEAGNDVLLGGAGIDTLDGGTEQDALYGDGGNDILIGGAGDDFAFGMADDDVLYGDAGIDVLLGGDGTDTLYGGADGDALYGEAGTDTLYGGSGNDFIFTGTGSDVVVFEAAAGVDQIYDFDATGADKLRFAASSGVASFADLAISDGGSYTIVVYNAGTQAIYLWGTPRATVDASDFIFG